MERGPTAYLAVVAGSRVLAAGVALSLFMKVLGPVESAARASVKRAFRQGLPYMLNAGSSFVFLRADILLLGVISGTHAVSIYGGVADPLVTMGATISIVNVAFLPSLASAGPERQRLAGRMLVVDLVLGASLALLLAATAGIFADRFLNGESESVEVLQVLCFGLLLRFVNNGLATWLTAAGHQWRRTTIAIAAGGFNIVVNVVAISLWGYWAAVWVTLVTECLILGLSLVALGTEMSTAGRTRDAEGVGLPVKEGYGIGPE
jgi:O-antigen/teichoic acid export membrane protein